MKREDCWMTFSEALKKYLAARALRKATNSPRVAAEAHQEVVEAVEHMEALTGGEP